MQKEHYLLIGTNIEASVPPCILGVASCLGVNTLSDFLVNKEHIYEVYPDLDKGVYNQFSIIPSSAIMVTSLSDKDILDALAESEEEESEVVEEVVVEEPVEDTVE